MCLVAFALRAARDYPLIFAANRDERHARPSRAAGWWHDRPWIFGGRDLRAQGSWLGVDRRGRLAAVTNFAEPGAGAAARSRGELIAQFLSGDAPSESFAGELEQRAAQYGPFSLLLFDGEDVRYCSNRAPAARLDRGVHALSNAALGADWPKTRTARCGLSRLLECDAPLEPLFELLAQRAPADSADDPYRSALFVEGAAYGTRSSTVVLIDDRGTMTFAERSFDSAGRLMGEVRAAIALTRSGQGSTRRQSA
jgi:uncharacterized protein with NRDE domain